MQMLIMGSRGQEVVNLQEALNYQLPLAEPALKPDGDFGSRTQARVKEFQTVRGLKPDGIVGPQTQNALYNFVQNRLHVIVPPARKLARPRLRLGFALNDVPNEPVLPPVPRLTLPFPDPFRPPAPPLLPLPKLTLGGLATEFELEAGVQRTFSRTLAGGDPTGEKAEKTTSIFSNVGFSIWRRPIGKHVDLQFGPGAFLEREIRTDAVTTFRVGVFAKAELTKVLTIGPLDLFKLIVEHKTATTVTGPIELTSDLEVGINPTVEVEVNGTRIEFGPKVSKFFEVGIGRNGFEVKSGHTVTAGTVTVFF